MHNDIKEVLISEEELHAICERLGAQISKDYAGRELLMVGILKGSVVFMSDLMRCIDIPCEIDFMAVSSYKSGKESSGVVRILKDLDRSITGMDLLIVEDILDSGVTLSYIKKLLASRNPASIGICTLLDKPARRVAEIVPDYVGTIVPNEFVVGYGLDFDEKYRNLPYLGALKDEMH